jgi:hypothetical protein
VRRRRRSKSERGWNNSGVAFQALDKLDDAERTFNYLTLNPNSAQGALQPRGREEAAQRREGGAAACRDRGAHDPKHAEAWLVGD